jgi:hypothetical protein
MKIYYVTREIDKGTIGYARATWDGPFTTEGRARFALDRAKTSKPQFDFVVEVEDETGEITDL